MLRMEFENNFIIAPERKTVIPIIDFRLFDDSNPILTNRSYIIINPVIIKYGLTHSYSIGDEWKDSNSMSEIREEIRFKLPVDTRSCTKCISIQYSNNFDDEVYSLQRCNFAVQDSLKFCGFCKKKIVGCDKCEYDAAVSKCICFNIINVDIIDIYKQIKQNNVHMYVNYINIHETVINDMVIYTSCLYIKNFDCNWVPYHDYIDEMKSNRASISSINESLHKYISNSKRINDEWHTSIRYTTEIFNYINNIKESLKRNYKETLHRELRKTHISSFLNRLTDTNRVQRFPYCISDLVMQYANRWILI